LTLKFLLLKLPLPLLADLSRLSKDKLLELLLLPKHLLTLFLDHALLIQLLLLHLLDDLEILLFEVLILLLLLVEVIQVFHVGFLLGATITPRIEVDCRCCWKTFLHLRSSFAFF